jgi:hypothetical protein
VSGSRFYVIAAGGGAAIGRDLLQPAPALAREMGEGTHVIDTMAMPYEPMARRMEGGEPVYVEFGAWDTRGDADANLIEAVKKGYVPIVQAFLAKGADPKAADTRGGPAILWAVARGKADVLRLLLEAGADPNAADKDGDTPLKLAAQRGKSELAVILKAAGAKG